MSVQSKGSFVPLAWGTIAISGYVNESTGEDDSTGEHLIEDEAGDVVTQTTNFGLKTDVAIDVIPSSSATRPAAGTVFSYGAKKMTIITISAKRIKKDVEKWSLKGNRFPGVPLDS